MEKLPSFYREWYLVYLSQYDKTERIKIAPDKEIERWMLALGRAPVLQFLKTKSIPLDDPDCSLLSDPNICGIEELFLKNSHLLFQKEDAYFLLEEARKIPYPYMARWWYIGAAQLLPERAGAILREILDKLKYPIYSGETAYHLFRLVESHKITYLRDWFYRSNKKARFWFIHLLEKNDLPGKENLIRALLIHKKSKTLERDEISYMVEILEQDRAHTNSRYENSSGIKK